MDINSFFSEHRLTATAVANFGKGCIVRVQESSSQLCGGVCRDNRTITLTGFPPRMGQIIKHSLELIPGLPTETEIVSAVKRAEQLYRATEAHHELQEAP